MKQRLLEYLICPECHNQLILTNPVYQNEEVWQGELKCSACQAAYAISEGIPRFIPEAMDSVVQRNVENFGAQWHLLGERSDVNRREFLSYLDNISEDFFKDKVILDAGCGMGKFLYYAAEWGAKDVIGIDLSDSVEVASRWTREMPNAHVIQADIYKLPLRGGFDFIYSIGVLHHLPDPPAGFHSLTKLLHRGGTILAWVYGYEGNQAYIKIADPIRRITCRLPLRVNKLGARMLAGILWVVIWLIYLPANRLGFKRLPMSDYFLYFYELGFPFFWGTVLDKMIPSISHHYRREEFARWWENFVNVRLVQRNGNSWTGVGVKA